MPIVDLFILTVLVLYLAKGIWRGALLELCSACGLAAGVVLASRFAPGLGAELTRTVQLDSAIAEATLYVALFLIGTLTFALLGFFLGRLPALPGSGGPGRVVGGLFGLLQGVVVLALLLQALTLHPWPRAVGPVLRQGTLSPPFVQLGASLYRGGESVAAALH